MENRIIRLESDFRMLQQTLSSIDETLKELKAVNLNLHKMELDQLGEQKDINSLNDQIKLLFDFKNIAEKRLRELEKTDSVQGVKLGSGEKIGWLVVSSVVGYFAFMLKSGVN